MKPSLLFALVLLAPLALGGCGGSAFAAEEGLAVEVSADADAGPDRIGEVGIRPPDAGAVDAHADGGHGDAWALSPDGDGAAQFEAEAEAEAASHDGGVDVGHAADGAPAVLDGDVDGGGALDAEVPGLDAADAAQDRPVVSSGCDDGLCLATCGNVCASPTSCKCHAMTLPATCIDACHVVGARSSVFPSCACGW